MKDKEVPQTMKEYDDIDVNKLIEESEKNKELIYNVICSSDRHKQISSTATLGEPKISVEVNTDMTITDWDIVKVERNVPEITINLTHEVAIQHLDPPSTHLTYPKNMFLNKWAKDQCRERASMSNERATQSIVRVIPAKENHNETECDLYQHQKRMKISTPPIPLNNRRLSFHQQFRNVTTLSMIINVANIGTSCDIKLVDQSQWRMDHTVSPNIDHEHNSHKVESVMQQPNGDSVPTSSNQQTTNGALLSAKLNDVVSSMAQTKALLIQANQSALLRSLVTNVLETSEIQTHRPVSSYTQVSNLPVVNLDDLPCMPEINVPSMYMNQSLLDEQLSKLQAVSNNRINQMNQQLQQYQVHKNLQDQLILERLNKQQLIVNELEKNLEAMQILIQAQSHIQLPQSPLLGSLSPQHASQANQPQQHQSQQYQPQQYQPMGALETRAKAESTQNPNPQANLYYKNSVAVNVQQAEMSIAENVGRESVNWRRRNAIKRHNYRHARGNHVPSYQPWPPEVAYCPPYQVHRPYNTAIMNPAIQLVPAWMQNAVPDVHGNGMQNNAGRYLGARSRVPMPQVPSDWLESAPRLH